MTAAPSESWAVALHATPDDDTPIGAGVVVHDDLILACAHVAFHGGALRDLWVAFPRAFHVPPGVRRRVSACRCDGIAERNVDLVLLELAEPVPSSVEPARLRRPSGPDLVGLSWRSFGFPHGGDGGRSASGIVDDEGSYGRVRLSSPAGTGVAAGFSGAALLSPEYGSVVGIVVSADEGTGSGYALTLAYADEHLPGMKLSTLDAWKVGDADEPTHAAWGWALSTDAEAGRHWLPRSRGVASGTESGSRFRGRAAALRRIRAFLDGSPAGCPMVVTGSPGVGKSAVLGRIVTTADREIAASLPADDTAERATVGSVACAVHVKGKTALEVAEELARGLGLALPRATVDLLPALRDRLTARPSRVNLVVDALDEAVTPADARALIDDVLAPLARTGAALGVQVVVGTRRSDGLGHLIGAFGSDAELIDLDAPGYFSPEDLAAYAQATLQAAGSRAYAHEADAAPVAARIAALADRNFLVAGLVARTRALRDPAPVRPAEVSFTPTVADTLGDYVSGLPGAGPAPAALALTALAYAETPGLSISLWQVAVEALGAEVTASQLSEFARSSAANFLVETGDPARPTYRLFHQALNDALLAGRRRVGLRVADERRLVRMWIDFGRSGGWSEAPGYLMRSLPQHAARVGAVDELLTDDDYLLHAQLDRLLVVAESAETEAGRARKLLLQRTPRAVGAGPGERASLFSVVDRLDDLRTGLTAREGPYRAAWAHTPPRLERTVLEGHSLAVCDVCAIAVDGRNLLASAGEDGTVRLWDPLTNQTVQVLNCHDDCIAGVCAVPSPSGALLATAGHDGTIGIWDPRSGQRLHSLTGHRDWVRNLCALPVPGGAVLASAGDDRTVRIWDAAAGIPVRTLAGHSGWVTAVTHVPVEPYGLLASTGFDATVRLWDPLTGEALHVLRGHDGWVTTLYAFRAGDRVLLASGGYDGTVRLWDPITGLPVGCLATGGGRVTDLCTVRTAAGDLLAATDEVGTIRLWDTATGAERPALHGHASWIRAVCELPMPEGHMLATAGDDGTVRLWDPNGVLPRAMPESTLPGSVAGLCAVAVEGRSLVASAGGDGAVRLWEVGDGSPAGVMRTQSGAVAGVCLVEDDELLLLAVAGQDSGVQLWDLVDLDFTREFREHLEPVNAVAVLRTGDGLLMASAGEDETVRLWRPYDARVRAGLVGHRNWVTSLAAVERSGRPALASADKNGVVRLWAADGTALWEQHSHQDGVNALGAVTVDGRPLLVSAGVDRTVRLWDTEDGRPVRVMTGHTAAVTGVDVVEVDGRRVLASAALDRTVRLWDLRTGRPIRVIPVHHRALACRWVDGHLVVGLDCGLLALEFSRL